MNKFATLALLLAPVAAKSPKDSDSAMKTMLDDMAVYFEVDNGKFD